MKETILLEGASTISRFIRLNANSKRDLPLRASQIGFLIYVTQSAIPTTPLQAAKFFGVSKSVVSKTIQPLVQNGFLKKQPSETDGRSYDIAVTTKAIELVSDVENEYFKVIKQLLAKMGEKKFTRFLRFIEEANSIIEHND